MNRARKSLVGHHLMRVRIRASIFEALSRRAEEETERTGEHVTVSDLVRSACNNDLLVAEAVARLENQPPPILDEEVLIVETLML